MDLVDTSVLVEFLRARPGRARDYVRSAAGRPGMATTEPIAMEVLAGAITRVELSGVEHLVDAMTLLPLEPGQDFHRAAEIFREARASGQTVRKMNDCLIAAVAERRGARVVHRDADFETIATVVPLRTLDLR